MHYVDSANCNRYPKLIGGDVGNTNISQIDHYKGSIVAVGSTYDPVLGQSSSTSTNSLIYPVPFIAMFLATQTSMIWGKVMVGTSIPPIE